MKIMIDDIINDERNPDVVKVVSGELDIFFIDGAGRLYWIYFNSDAENYQLNEVAFWVSEIKDFVKDCKPRQFYRLFVCGEHEVSNYIETFDKPPYGYIEDVIRINNPVICKFGNAEDFCKIKEMILEKGV